MATKKHLYKVIFFNQGEVYEIFARSVSQGGLFGFIEIEELVFGEKKRVVIDPSQERLEREFEGVKRTYLPLHSVVRIDEVAKEGTGRITALTEDQAKIRSFPHIMPPGRDSNKK